MWQIRQMIALLLLAICSYTDIRERNIYLFPLAVSSAGTLAMFTVSWFFASPVQSEHILLYDILLPAAVSVVIIMIVKAGGACIGMGDGYLMASLGLILGLQILFAALSAAFIAAAVFAGFRIVSAKKRFKGTIPFAPFIMAGFLAVTVYEI